MPTDPGLSTAQLMLTNDDLRPGETNLSKITRFYLVKSIDSSLSIAKALNSVVF